MSEQHKLYISSRDVVIVNGRGPSALFRAGVPRPLRPSLVNVAIGKGITAYADGDTTPRGSQSEPVQASEKSNIGQIASSIRAIMDRGSKGDFTASGSIRISALEKEVGFNIDVDDRDAAMATIDAVNE
jgi:hypothetical protein